MIKRVIFHARPDEKDYWVIDQGGIIVRGDTLFGAILSWCGMLLRRIGGYIIRIEREGIATHPALLNVFHYHGLYNRPGDVFQVKIWFGLGYVQFGFYLTRFWVKPKNIRIDPLGDPANDKEIDPRVTLGDNDNG